MSGPSVRIKLDGHLRVFRPGEMLSGVYDWQVDPPARPARVELSVLWHTEGKGDEDFAVHFFDAFEPADATSEAHRSARFATQLPNSPLSYDGAILKIRWCVRVRLFLRDGREFLAEKEFQLGNIPSVRSRKRGALRSSRTSDPTPDTAMGKTAPDQAAADSQPHAPPASARSPLPDGAAAPGPQPAQPLAQDSQDSAS